MMYPSESPSDMLCIRVSSNVTETEGRFGLDIIRKILERGLILYTSLLNSI